MALALSGRINVNRGGHPFVVVSESDPAFRTLEATEGKYQNGSLSSGKRFHESVAVIVDGQERQATGIGAIFYEYERERSRSGRVKEIKVPGSGQRYVYLQESAPVGQRVHDGRRGDPDQMDQWAQWPSDRRAVPSGIDQ